MPESTKKALSWLIAVLGAVSSVVWLGYVGYQIGPNPGAPLSGWLATGGLVLAGIAPLSGSFFALRSPKRAALVFLVPVPFLVIWFLLSGPPPQLATTTTEGTTTNAGAATAIFSLLIFPGLFWLLTGRLGWPSALSRAPRLRGKVVATLLSALSVLAVAVCMDLYSYQMGGCGYSTPPFTKQLFPEQAVFTARVLRAGLLWPSESVAKKWQGSPKKYWALALIQKPFWGLAWWDRKIVVLTLRTIPEDPFQRGETYFVDGRHLPGSLTRFLPVFDTFCSRTKRIKDAEVELRVLHDGPPREGIRIMGRTVRYTGHNLEPVPGIKVAVEGPSGRLIITSDSNGIYDVSGLPPGKYDIGRQLGDGKVYWQHPALLLGREGPTHPGDIRDCTVFVQ
jgi:hypothetical protein